MHPAQLRVAIVSDAQPERNGVGTYYRDLAEHLEPIVGEVTFLGPGAGEPALRRWLRMPLPGDATQQVEVPSPIGLRRRLESLRPHAVVAATPGPYGLLGARYAAALQARLVVGLHTDFEALSALYWGAVFGRINRWGMAAVHRRLFRRADCVVANSPGMLELARRNGVASTELMGTQLPRDFLERPPAPVGERVGRILFVGRLAAEKRVHRVIEAAERLPHLSFAIAGEGPLRAEVEAAAARLDNLSYLGWLARPGIREALDGSDLLVLPSDVEAFGTVALEALARARMALVSPGCGIRDWPDLARGLCEMDPREHLADTIGRLARLDPEARRAHAREGREAVLAMSRATCTQWLEVLGARADATADEVA